MKDMIYLDNAATTALAPEVKSAMTEAMDLYGNPSSIHAAGRSARIAVEKARRDIARELKAESGEIFFTGSGTEADNLAILSSIRDLDVERIITLPTEHHAVINPVQFYAGKGWVESDYLKMDEKGDFDLAELESMLKAGRKKTLVSIMYGNNEIGNLQDIQAIGTICKEHGALFHSDTVQTVGHFSIDLQQIPVDFITASAHKFNGPKGVGFLFARGGLKINPQIFGGGQERKMRSGTENVMGIVGLGTAFNLAYADLEPVKKHISSLKSDLIRKLKAEIPDIQFNGHSGELDKSLYTVLNLALPFNKKTEMLLFQLDMKGIAASGGSACNSGSQKKSHVIEALRPGSKATQNIRISIGRYNRPEDIDAAVEALTELIS